MNSYIFTISKIETKILMYFQYIMYKKDKKKREKKNKNLKKFS